MSDVADRADVHCGLARDHLRVEGSKDRWVEPVEGLPGEMLLAVTSFLLLLNNFLFRHVHNLELSGRAAISVDLSLSH